MRKQKSGGNKCWRVSVLVVLTNYLAVKSERAYPLGCSQEAPSYYDYDNSVFPPHDVSIFSTKDFLLLRRLGAGKFSDVFEAVDDQESSLVVLKCLKPVSDRKIRRELLVLSHASLLPNLARLRGLVVPKSFQEQSVRTGKLHPMPSLVLEHAGPESQWLCHGRVYDAGTSQQESNNDDNMDPFLSEYEIKYYLCHLLIALDALHSRGIMHRDVKPRNVLINRTRRANELPLMLIDLGLADFYLPNTRYNVRVASRHYKSPELLVGYEYYDYALDMWGVGCILAGLLLRREPFFRGKDNIDQLGKIMSVLGTADLVSYVTKYNVELTPEVGAVVSKYAMRPGGQRRRPWVSLLTKGRPIPSRDGLNLLDNLLVYDHDSRLTAQQAMRHSFFDEVRDRVAAEVEKRAVGGTPPALSTPQRSRSLYPDRSTMSSHQKQAE